MDQYEKEYLDEDEIAIESYEKRMEDRMAAEEAIDAYHAKQQARARQRDDNLERVTDFERRELDSDEEDELEQEELDEGADRPLNLEAFDSPLREWIAEERTRREIHRRFKKFLSTYYVGIDEVVRWVKKHEHSDPPVGLPPHLRAAAPIYPPKIK